jgi:hypothetical protein
MNKNNKMKKVVAYSKAKSLAKSLGQKLTTKWIGSTTHYWRKEVKKLTKVMRLRRKKFTKVLTFSVKHNLSFVPPPTLEGTTVKHWSNKLNGMRRRVKARRRPPITVTKAEPIAVGKTYRVKKQKLPKINYDQMMDKGQYEKSFNLVLTSGVTMSSKQAIRWMEEIINLKGKRLMSLVNIRGETQTLTLNNRAYDFITRVLTEGHIADQKANFESDTLTGYDFTLLDHAKITTLTGDKYGFIKDKDGRFFPYINKTNIDLSRYQIYTEAQSRDALLIKSREQCLMHALKMAGVEGVYINRVKYTYITKQSTGTDYLISIKKSSLKEVAHIIKRNIVLHEYEKGSRLCKKVYETEAPDYNEIHIALYLGHYFVFETTIYTSFALRFYKEVKDIADFHNIYRRDNGKKGITYRTKSAEQNNQVHSLRMVALLYENNYFGDLDMSMFAEHKYDKNADNYYLDNIAEEQELYERKSKTRGEKKKKIYFADTETYVAGGNHTLQLIGLANDTHDCVDVFNVGSPRYGGDARKTTYDFLDRLAGRKNKYEVICYFHNLKYDYHILEPYMNVIDKCMKDGSYYSVTVLYKKTKIEFRDSFKLLPFALSKFQKNFNLDPKYSKKEAIAYEYYTPYNNGKRVKTRKYRRMLNKEDRKIFKKNMKTEYSYDKKTKTFNPMDYYKDYLRLDCLVLKYGLLKFNDIIKEITGGMEIYDSLTISSLTDKYMYQRGSYDGVCSVKGNLREYIAQAVYGGRVAVNKKYEKKIIEGKISDYDGCSLYPSAINRLTREIGLPTGKAKRYNPDELKAEAWQDKIYSIMTVKINKVNKTQQIPFIAHKGETSTQYLNVPPEKPIIIDSITLQDYIKFHKIEYELIDGVYWNDKGNKKMGEVIRELYDTRLKYKKTNKALANTLKLMLNSAYGKTIMKKANTQCKVVRAKGFEKYVYMNFNTIKKYRRMNDNNYEVTSITADTSSNRGHIGCAILSMSKRIMNEVFNVAENLKCPIYYTDTDSLHCNLEDVPKIEDEYQRVYGKQLNGKQLEQFHTDFDLEGATSEIYANKSIFLGKKSYIDMLESKDANGDVITGSHIRLKGITAEGLEDAAKRYTNDHTTDYFALFSDLAQGREVRFILNPYNEDKNHKKVLFEYKAGTVSTRQEFVRAVSF